MKQQERAAVFIVIYTKPDCSFCDRAKKLLQNFGYEEYEEIVVGKDVSSEVYKTMFPNHTTTPGIIINNKFIGGYTELREYLI